MLQQTSLFVLKPKESVGRSSEPDPEGLGCVVPLKYIEYGFGYILIRSSYTPYSIYLRGTVRFRF